MKFNSLIAVALFASFAASSFAETADVVSQKVAPVVNAQETSVKSVVADKVAKTDAKVAATPAKATSKAKKARKVVYVDSNKKVIEQPATDSQPK